MRGESGAEKSRRCRRRMIAGRASIWTFLRSRVIPGAKLKGFRILLDCANGAAYKLGPELFRSLGADLVTRWAVAPDGRNINAGCGSLHLEGLQKRVKEEGVDAGCGV